MNFQRYQRKLCFVCYGLIIVFPRLSASPLTTTTVATPSPSSPPSPDAECADGEFQCHSKDCIHYGLYCDGISDCLDGSDEFGCCMFVCVFSVVAFSILFVVLIFCHV